MIKPFLGFLPCKEIESKYGKTPLDAVVCDSKVLIWSGIIKANQFLKIQFNENCC
jgi:hypothetical protein